MWRRASSPAGRARRPHTELMSRFALNSAKYRRRNSFHFPRHVAAGVLARRARETPPHGIDVAIRVELREIPPAKFLPLPSTCGGGRPRPPGARDAPTRN